MGWEEHASGQREGDREMERERGKEKTFREGVMHAFTHLVG
jgi:hypothetical protein